MLISNACKALTTNSLLISFSKDGDDSGLPNGWVIAIDGTIRFAPVVTAVETKLHNKITGIPALSISFASVAPQRVPVPQVDVNITAETLPSDKCWAISLPNFCAFCKDV